MRGHTKLSNVFRGNRTAATYTEHDEVLVPQSHQGYVQIGHGLELKETESVRALEAKRWLLQGPTQLVTDVLQELAAKRPGVLGNREPGRSSRRSCREGGGICDMLGPCTPPTSEDEDGLEVRSSHTSMRPLLQPNLRGPSNSMARFPTRTSALPILQFSNLKYLCSEEEGSVKLEVLRLGADQHETRVRYRTYDRTATAHQHYIPASGVLVFGPYETEKEIEIELVDDSFWTANNEFHVVLEEEGLEHGALNVFAVTARVQRLDDDLFPSNRYKDKIQNGAQATINPVFLFFEYFKFNFANPTIRHGTIKTMLIDQSINLCGLFTLVCQIYLVDHILVPAAARRETDLHMGTTASLLLVVGLRLIPLIICTFLTYCRTKCSISSNSRMTLSCGLVDAFMNYDEASRNDVRASDLIFAMTEGTEVILQVGYLNFLRVFKLLGKSSLNMAFQLSIHMSSQTETTRWPICLMLLVPALMFCAAAARFGTTRALLHDRMERERDLMQEVHHIVLNFRLIADYGKRVRCMEDHMENLRKFSTAYTRVKQATVIDEHSMKWANAVVTSLYLVSGGMEVARGDLPIGVFLVCAKVCMAIGDMWEQVYTTLEESFNNAPALERCVSLMNLPSDARNHMAWYRRKTAVCRDERERIREKVSEEVAGRAVFEHIPLKVHNIFVTLRATSIVNNKAVTHRETMMRFNNVCFWQGEFVALVGASGLGKTTLLSMIGNAILPDQECLGAGTLCIPTHLKVLHVSRDTMFVRGGLYKNLIFGVEKKRLHIDGRVDRVQQICQLLGLSEEIISQIGEDAKADNAVHKTTQLAWVESLSASEKRLLSLARALVVGPDILCVHNPTMHVTTKAAETIWQILREYVDSRGIAFPGNSCDTLLRSPCTVITTCSLEHCSRLVDKIYDVDGITGKTELVEKETSSTGDHLMHPSTTVMPEPAPDLG